MMASGTAFRAELAATESLSCERRNGAGSGRPSSFSRGLQAWSFAHIECRGGRLHGELGAEREQSGPLGVSLMRSGGFGVTTWTAYIELSGYNGALGMDFCGQAQKWHAMPLGND